MFGPGRAYQEMAAAQPDGRPLLEFVDGAALEQEQHFIAWVRMPGNAAGAAKVNHTGVREYRQSNVRAGDLLGDFHERDVQNCIMDNIERQALIMLQASTISRVAGATISVRPL
jgi:hypothetical protein